MRMMDIVLPSPSSAYRLLFSVFLLLSTLTVFAQTNGHPRVWTAKNGKQITAELRSYSNGYVTLHDGKGRVQVKDTALSDADRQYLCGICDPNKGIAESELPKRLRQLDSGTPAVMDGKQKGAAEPAEKEDGNGNTMKVTAAMQRGETSKNGWQTTPVKATPEASKDNKALSAFHEEASTDKVPVTLRATSMAPEAFASLLPSGFSTNTLDSVTMQRLEMAVGQGKAKKVELVQKTVKCGQEEQISSHSKEIYDEEGRMFQVGFMGNVSIAKVEPQFGYLAKVRLMWNDPGSVDGPSQSRGEKLMRRVKALETAVVIQPGASTLLGVFPACPTDGNRNVLLVILTVGGAPAAKAGGVRPAVGRSCVVELFALPAGSKDQPDVAALQRMRSNPKAKVAEMRAQGVVDTPCTGQADTELSYFTGPGQTEFREVGFHLWATPGTNESEIVFEYTTLVSPYTSADFKRAASERGGKNAKPDDFFMKYAPHIVAARFESKVQNTGTPVVVPLTIKTDENREGDAAKAPVFFALVSSVAR